MDGFQRRKEQSKEDIRRAAEELFSKLSADKVSIDDIARKAGVSQATIYNNFGSKENLVHDYRKGIVSTVAGRFRDILVWKKSYIEKLEGLFQSVIDFTGRYQGEMDAAGSATPLAGEVEKSLREFIKLGKKQGNLRADLSDEAVVDYLRFFQQGIANNPDIRERISRDLKLSSDLLSLFIYGVCGEASASPAPAYSGAP